MREVTAQTVDSVAYRRIAAWWVFCALALTIAVVTASSAWYHWATVRQAWLIGCAIFGTEMAIPFVGAYVLRHYVPTYSIAGAIDGVFRILAGLVLLAVCIWGLVEAWIYALPRWAQGAVQIGVACLLLLSILFMISDEWSSWRDFALCWRRRWGKVLRACRWSLKWSLILSLCGSVLALIVWVLSLLPRSVFWILIGLGIFYWLSAVLWPAMADDIARRVVERQRGD